MKTSIAIAAIVFSLAPLYTGATFGSCHTSTGGKILIRNFEGFSPIVYDDGVGNPTIGYGHMLRSGEHFKYVTPDQAERLLEADLEPGEHYINTYASRPLKNQECDSLESLIFNTGMGGKDKLIARVNKHQDPLIIEFDHARVNGKEVELKGLKIRRQAEAALYNL